MAGCLRFRARGALALSILLSLAGIGRAQQPGTLEGPAPLPPPETAAPFKLHVYANLVQVPTLVLSSKNKLLPPIAREGFDISLDSGRVFHPTQMRMEGNDPIALGILFDAGGDQAGLLAKAAETFSVFAQRQLHADDSITLYALDCKIMHNLMNAPAQPALVQSGVEHLLAAPGLHGDKRKPACSGTLRLWDAVMYAANSLGKLPGRRILLVVSAGIDTNSKTGIGAVSEFLTNRAVALFGMRNPEEIPEHVGFQSSPGRGFNSSSLGRSSSRSGEDLFELLCAQNGGLVLKAGPNDIGIKLDEFAAFVRGRYILEFPRPDGGDPGVHLIRVTVAGKRDYLIRSTGVPITLPDPALLNDPNTLHSQPSPATFGPRKPLPKH